MEYIKFIKQQHDKFINDKPIDTDNIPSYILDSWKSCKRKGVDPYDGFGKPLNKHQTEKRKRQNQDLIDIAKPQIETLYKSVAGSGFVVNLVDRDGYILDEVGDKEVLGNARDLNFDIGSNWDEDKVGTNGISLALNNGKPYQVVGPEHYCISHHNWTCSSCPIFNSQGQVVGVLNMSGPSDKKHPHTLGMVVAAVSSIENQLKLLEKSHEIEVANKKLSAIIESSSDGLLSVDAKGKINHVNHNLARQMQVSPQKLIGENITKLNINLDFFNILSHKTGYVDREIRLKGNDKSRNYYVTASIIWDNNAIQDIVFTFREMKKAQGLVNKVLGARVNYSFDHVITNSEAMHKSIRLGQAASDSISNVLLMGESGTGKEIFAQAIHNEGPRRKEPFIAVNCAALPRDLIESELFGYERGAFSGAKKEGNPGKFELADGGTLLLDEIGEMSLELQVKLLRVLQEKQITRIGGTKTIPVDVRIITSTNKDLMRSVQRKEFREDLYYRLNVLSIKLPPLRGRKEDIPVLINHFIDKYNRLLDKKISKVSDDTMELFMNYRWPGNVREVENIIERAANIVEGNEITVDHLPEDLTATSPQSVSNTPRALDELEKQNILQALADCDYNITRAAEVLNIARNTLYRKMKKYNIQLQS